MSARPSAPGRSARGWLLTLSVLCVLIAVGVAALVVGIVKHADTAMPRVTASEQQAMDASRQLIANVGTFTRADFDSDWDRAVAGMTGSLKSQFQQADAKTEFKKGLDAQQWDISAKVSDVGVVSTKGDSVNVVAVMSRWFTPSTGQDAKQQVQIAPLPVQAVVTEVGGKWLLSNMTNVQTV